MRGDEDGADAAIAAALERAATLAHPLTETYVYTVAALLAQMQDDPDAALHRAKRAVTVASEHAIPVFEALASPLAWATARLELGGGISLQRQALSGMARTGTAATLTAAMATLAELLGAAGDTDGALATVGQALAIAQAPKSSTTNPNFTGSKPSFSPSAATADAAAAAASAISAADTQGSMPFAARARRVLAALSPEV